MVRQDPGARDMPEAVLGLMPLCQTVSYLLLPDVVYRCSGDPFGQMLHAMGDTGFCFAAAKASPGALARLGALRTEGGRVIAYEDKPAVPGMYDCAWGILGFHGFHGEDGLDLIRSSTAGERPVVTEEPLCGSPVTWLDSFRDCGTWESYREETGGSVLH